LLLREFHFLPGHFLRSVAQARRFLIRMQMMLARAKPLFPQHDWMEVLLDRVGVSPSVASLQSQSEYQKYRFGPYA
jgi:hypothetical protein